MQLRAIALLSVICATWSGAMAAPAAPLSDKLPGSTLLYFASAGKTLAYDGSLAGQLLSEPGIQEALTALRRAISGEQMGPQAAVMAQVMDLIDTALVHPMAIAVLDVKPTGQMPAIQAALLVDLGADKEKFQASLEKTMLLTGIDKQLQDASAAGLSYKTLTPQPGLTLSVGYMGNVLFLTLGEDTPAILAQVDTKKSLAEDKGFLDALKTVTGPNLQSAFYANVPLIISRAEGFMGDEATRGPKVAEFRKVIKALGVDQMRAIVGATVITDRITHNRLRVISPAPHRGLLALAAAAPLTNEDLAHVPADALGVLSFKLPAKALYAELLTTIEQLDPAAKEQMTEEVARVERALSLSLNDLLESLGDTWTIYSAPSAGGLFSGLVLTVDVKDPARFQPFIAKAEAAIKAVALAESGFGPQRMTVTTMPAGQAQIRYLSIAGKQMPVAPAWAIQNNKLYVTLWPQVLQDAVKAPAEPLVKDAGFAKTRSRLLGKPSAMCYIDTPRIVRTSYGLLAGAWTVACGELSLKGMPCRVDWLPSLRTLEAYLVPDISAVSSDADGIMIENSGNGVTGMVPAALMVTVMVPALSSARGQAQQATSAAQLRAIGAAVTVYLGANEAYPPSITVLVDEKLIPAKFLVSPVSGRQPPQKVNGVWVGERDYVLISGLDDSADGNLVLAYERPENYGGRGTIVLHVAGNVEWVDIATFERLLLQTRDHIVKRSKN